MRLCWRLRLPLNKRRYLCAQDQQPAGVAMGSAGGALPAGWSQHMSEEGVPYYFHEASGQALRIFSLAVVRRAPSLQLCSVCRCGFVCRSELVGSANSVVTRRLLCVITSQSSSLHLLALHLFWVVLRISHILSVMSFGEIVSCGNKCNGSSRTTVSRSLYFSLFVCSIEPNCHARIQFG